MNYEKKMNENVKRNEKYLPEFEKWLNKKGLVNKTIRKHLNNTSLFINDYLNYYDITKAEDGLDEVFPFLNGWFIEKCTWSSRNSLKETVASLKKFYQYMSENNYVDVIDYKKAFDFIKDNMDELLESVDKFNNFDEDDYYDLFYLMGGKKMTKVLTFRVGIEGLEDKIWREIEITDRRTVADLAYTVLATFDSLAYHLYNIKYKNYIFDSWVCVEDNPDYEKLSNATITKLSELKLKKNDELEMEYDYDSTTTFKITYIDKKDMNEYEGYLYPIISDGAGRGMLDDMCDFDLKEIVDDTDKKGYSEHYVTPGYEKYEKYDYRKFNLKTNNKKLKGLVLEIKNGYEVDGE